MFIEGNIRDVEVLCTVYLLTDVRIVCYLSGVLLFNFIFMRERTPVEYFEAQEKFILAQQRREFREKVIGMIDKGLCSYDGAEWRSIQESLEGEGFKFPTRVNMRGAWIVLRDQLKNEGVISLGTDGTES